MAEKAWRFKTRLAPAAAAQASILDDAVRINRFSTRAA